MSNEEKKKLILDFINGPLEQYLTGNISYGRFKEIINEKCGTDFTYSELYPSYLFNAQISYPAEDEEASAYSRNKHVQKYCSQIIPGTFIMCGEGFGTERQYCSNFCYKKALQNE